MIIWFLTYLDTYREIVFLNPFKVERLIDFHVCVRPPIVLPLLEVERVVLVRLVRRTSDQLVEYGWVVLYTRAGWGNRLGVGPYWCLRRLHLIDCCYPIWSFSLKSESHLWNGFIRYAFWHSGTPIWFFECGLFVALNQIENSKPNQCAMVTMIFSLS